MQNIADAENMLEAFASVGANRFDVTFLDIDGQKRGFRQDQSIGQLKNSLPLLMPGLEERRNNLIVRPRAANLVQLDDLDAEKLKPLAGVAFLILETSPGNHQAWVGLDHIADAGKMIEFARRLRKGTGADPTASGAVRLAGTVNYKVKYGPDFPTIDIVETHPGRVVTAQHLEQLGVLAAKEPETRMAPPARVSRSGSWPDYQRCVEGAPLNHGRTGPDISRVDFMWCMMAAQRHHSIDEVAAKLMEVSAKAKENGEQYAKLTAQNATAAAQRGRTQSFG